MASVIPVLVRRKDGFRGTFDSIGPSDFVNCCDVSWVDQDVLLRFFADYDVGQVVFEEGHGNDLDFATCKHKLLSLLRRCEEGVGVNA